MAKDKKSFVLYADLIHTVKKMPKAKAGELFMTILEYVNDLNPEVKDKTVDLVFEPVKQQLKRDLKAYETIKQKRSEYGRQGGLKSGESRSKTKQNEASASTSKQNEANEAVNVTDTVNDTVTVTGINNNTASGDQKQTTHSTIYLKYSDYDRLGANLKDQVSWKEKCQIEFGLKEHEFNAWIDKWIAHIGTQAEQTRYLAPSQNYCANWIRKKLEQPATKSTNNNALTGRRVQR